MIKIFLISIAGVFFFNWPMHAQELGHMTEKGAHNEVSPPIVLDSRKEKATLKTPPEHDKREDHSATTVEEHVHPLIEQATKPWEGA